MPEPVSVATMKTHLNLEADFVEDDIYIATLTTAARRLCELKLNRALVSGTRKLVLDGFPGVPLDVVPGLLETWLGPITAELRDPRSSDIELPGGTLTGPPVIAYVDQDGTPRQLAADAYVVANDATPARVAPLGRWPATALQPGTVVISYAVSELEPDDLALACQAVMLLAGNWYTNREAAVLDVRGIPTELPLSVTWILASLRQFATS